MIAPLLTNPNPKPSTPPHPHPHPSIYTHTNIGIFVVEIPPCGELQALDFDDGEAVPSLAVRATQQPTGGAAAARKDSMPPLLALSEYPACCCADATSRILVADVTIRSRQLSCSSMQFVKSHIVGVCVFCFVSIVSAYVYMRRRTTSKKKQKINDIQKKVFLPDVG